MQAKLRCTFRLQHAVPRTYLLHPRTLHSRFAKDFESHKDSKMRGSESAAGQGAKETTTQAMAPRVKCKLEVELQQITGPVILNWVDGANEKHMIDSRSAPNPTKFVCNSYLGEMFVLRTEGGALIRYITLRATEATKQKEIYYPYTERYFYKVAVHERAVRDGCLPRNSAPRAVRHQTNHRDSAQPRGGAQ